MTNAVAKSEAGITLLEMTCILAIVGLLAYVALPSVPKATSRPRLEAYALETAALLKADRLAAIRGGAQIATTLDRATQTIRSGASRQAIRLPRDVGFDALLPERCGATFAGPTIAFFPSGSSCGGTIALSRPGSTYHVRVNWLTGSVDVVAMPTS